MAPCPSGHGDEAVCAFFNRLFGEEVVDDVVQYDAATGMGSLVYFDPCAQRRDPDRNFVAHADFDVAIQTTIRAVDDLVDRIRCCGGVWIGLVVGVEFFFDLGQPCIEQRVFAFAFTCV